MTTAIQWTDETWNPVVGCTQVAAGCDNCYAKTLHDMRHKAVLAGKKLAPQYAKPFERVQLMQERIAQPLSWRKPRRVFVNSVSDLFHPDVPDFFLDEVFAVMALADRHTFQVLTKRAGRMRSYMNAPDLRARIAIKANAIMRESRTTRGFDHALGHRFLWCSMENALPGEFANRLRGIADDQWPLPNVWLGVSVENKAALSRVGALRATTTAIRFVSFEPLLEEVWTDVAGIDWAIIGGESGKNARPFDLAWARKLLKWCRIFGVAPFVKQLGARPVEVDELAGGHMSVTLRDSHGGDISEWPEDLRVREFPTVMDRAEVSA